MQPAMTPEEWAALRYECLDDDALVIHDDADGVELVVYEDWTKAAIAQKHKLADDDRYALAALALHGQPFGFTYEDVAMLAGLFNAHETLIQRAAEQGYYAGEQGLADVIDVDEGRRILRKIEALLPPETP